MTFFKNIFISLILEVFLWSCGLSVDKAKDIPPADTLGVTASLIDAATTLTDTSNQYIYDFMKVVISERQLNLVYGLENNPEQSCDLSSEDSVFLKTLLIEKKKTANDTENSKNLLIRINELPKCLTRADVKDMLNQKKRFSTFTWNNSRLGFSVNNNKNWYSFSVPLFSKDRNKAVMMIRSLCPGLCGTGETLIFIKKADKWYSKTGGQWIH